MSSAFSDTAVSSHSLVHHILEIKAFTTPNNVALEFSSDVRLTYFELNEISNRVARYLQDQQSPGHEIVALCLEKSHVLVIALLAILKAGMAWVPLPLDAPPARIDQILRACNINVVLTSKSSRHIAGNLVPCTDIEEIMKSPKLQSYAGSNLEGDRNSTDICHILFTSGSTGTPKGVMIEHRAVIHNVWALVKQFNLHSKTRTLQFAAPTFDIFSLDLFMTFASGGCLVMASQSTIVENITSFIQNAYITYAHLTPTVIELIDPAGVTCLQVLSSSGEALSQKLGNNWRNQLRLFNAYGPTETIVCTTQELSGNQIDSAYIGRALPGLEVCILADGRAEEVSDGEDGEICVAGPQLFRGYLSEQINLTSPEIYRNGERFYRTGDLGRMETCVSGQKSIRYLGRKDGQVKVHGIRLDLEDVEQSILTCVMIKQCVVILPKCGSSAGRLCSIVVPHLPFATADSSPDQSQSPPIEELHASPELFSTLREAKIAATTRLPTHAIPATWWAVKQIPLTSSGKIDRAMLHTWLEKMDQQTYTNHMEIFTDVQQQQTWLLNDSEIQLLQSLWAEVLGRSSSSINPTISFIDMGADSLDVIQFITKARKAGLCLSLSQVFTAKTIQGLAGSIRPMEQSRKRFDSPSYIPFTLLPRTRMLGPILEDVALVCQIRVAEIEDIYPCTPYQSALMTLDLKCPMSYICAFSWTLRQDIDMDRFREAWENLAAIEPVLRNRLIWDASSQDFWQVTVRHKSIRWRKESFETPMALGHDLCRGFIEWDSKVQCSKFYLRIHHSIIDGWSLRLMLSRLKSIYDSQSIPDVSRMTFPCFIQHRLEEAVVEEIACEKFWNQYLEGTSEPDFPPLPSDPRHEVHATGRQSLSVPVNLQDIAMRYGVTPATILYSAAALVLGAHADSEDVVFGLILAGRDAPLDGIFQMLGPAFVSFPFRTRIDQGMALGLFLKNIERQVLDIIPHQHYGLQRIKKCGRGAAAACRFQTLIVVQPENENLAGEGLWETVHGQTSGLADSIPLSIELILEKGRALINCNFDAAYLSREDVSNILAHLDFVLRDMATFGPQDPLSKVKLAEKDAQSQMLDWVKDYGPPVNSCLHDLVHVSIQRHLERIAIYDQATKRQFTYRELDIYSTRLSTFIQAHCNVAPERIIAIAIEKSALAIITILAVLKTGCTYVPIDLSWPLERVRLILDDINATVVLCSSAGVGQFQGLCQNVLEMTEDCWSDVTATSPVIGNMALTVPSNLALIMYTSGSTGVPKGVMLEHRALSTSLTHLTRVFALGPGSRHLQFSSFVYDVSIADIFIPLLSGACICVPTEHNRLNLLSKTMKDMAIESAILTPSVVDLISPDDASTLKVLMTGGEMTKRSLICKWAPRVRLLNAYGPTEASITTSVTDCLSTNADPSNVGLNVTGWHWIVRRDHAGGIYPAPMGCNGEIAIAGHCLARGYLHNADLTQKQFVEAPQLTIGLSSSRIYLTGDIGRCEVDGTVRIIGRKDRMIKVNGIRVEPGESEHQLRLLGGQFSSCVVQCIYDDQRNARLAAFIEVGPSIPEVATGQGLITAEERTLAFQQMCQTAQCHLQELLPQQYVPTLFVPVTRIPRTASDKVDLKRLREELEQIPNASTIFVVNRGVEDESTGEAPATPAEIGLEAAFRQVFARKHQLTTAVDFFMQGGDSFAAIKLVSAARGHGFEISVRQVYDQPKLKDLAAVAIPLYEAPAGAVEVDSPSRPPPLRIGEYLRAEIAQQCGLPLDEIEDIYPASPFQEGLAAVTLIGYGENGQNLENTYNAHITFRLAKRVDVARLNQALELMVSRNPICRTRLVYSSKGTMQVVLKRHYIHKTKNQEGASLFHYWIQQDEHGDEMRLVLDINHALYDAWTIDQLLEDANYNYAHSANTRQCPQPYRNFIEYLSELNVEEASKYWTEQLFDASLSLFPRLPRPDYRARATASIDRQTVLNLENVKAQGISAATVVAAALALLLSAYSNVDDVCYGTTLSGREDPRLQDIAGPTLSTVPMRIQIRRDQTVAILLNEVQESILAMRQYQHYGLQNIARLLNNGARNACQFRTLLVIQQSTSSYTGDQEERIIQNLVPEETSMFVNYSLVVIAQVDATTGHMDLKIEYDPACIQKVEAERFIHQLEQTVTQCTNPSRPARDIELITIADRTEIMSWNPTPPQFSPKYLHHLFEEMVSRQPERPAIESISVESSLFKNLSYNQLDEYATKICERINSRSSSPPVIGVCFNKSPLMVIAMLGIWKSGRAFVTLDPTAPVIRLRAVLTDLGTDTLILTEPSQAHLFSPSEAIYLDQSLPTLMKEFTEEIRTEQVSTKKWLPGSLDIAYVMYTSGSSGVPKGVVVGHSAVATSLLDVTSTIGLNLNTRMLQFAAFTFDTCILEIFGTLITGGCVCMPSESQRLDGSLADSVQHFQVSQLILTPTVAQLLEPDKIQTVQSLVLVGEPPSRHLLELWTTAKPTARVMNGYGPTEASVHSSTNLNLCRDDPHNIGRATVCNMFIATRDNVDKLAAIGTVGELVICGNTLANGYLNKPDLTSQKFGVNLAWMTKLENLDVRYYRTGDLARYAPDGSIIYLGRRDLQAKINGQRLELLEIEWQIKRFGRVFGCVADVILSDLLVAFVMISPPQQREYEGPLPPKTLSQNLLNDTRKFLRSVLPEFMIPAIFVPVGSWPTTVSGKVDRRRLKASVESIIDSYRSGGGDSRRPPQNTFEKSLAKVWAEVIPISEDQIGLDDTVFLLGGDSITVIRIISAARRCHLNLDLTVTYQHSTLDAMAKSLEGGHPVSPNTFCPHIPFSLIGEVDKDILAAMASEKCHTVTEAVLDVYPCTAMQEALMISSTKSKGAFFNQEVFQLDSKTSVPNLITSLQAVWARHNILRTRIIHDEGYRSLQVVIDELLEVSSSEEQDIEKYLSKEALATPGYGERLSRFAVVTCRLHTYLVISQHHAVFDGWSLDLLLADIYREYLGRTTPNSQPQEFSSFIRRVIEVQQSSVAEQYWTQHLADLTISPLPQLKPSTTFEANQKYQLKVPRPSSAAFSLATIAEAAWGILLGRYTESEDVSFGTVRSGRTALVDNIDSILGPTIVTIPRRIRPIRTQRVHDYLEQVKSCMVETLAWEQFGYRNIRKLGDSHRQACKFTSIIVVQMLPPKTPEVEASILNPYLVQEERLAGADCLTVECQPQEDEQVLISVTYDDRVISTGDVRFITYHFSCLMSEMINKRDECLQSLDMAGKNGINQAREWNCTAIVPCTKRVDELFVERSREWPSLMAIEASDATLTYEMLDRLSSRLASRLKALGILRGDIVPLYMTKTAVMVVAMLAVLKAGAAYVPLSTDLPQERLCLLLNKLCAEHVLCTPDQEPMLDSVPVESICCEMKDLMDDRPKHFLSRQKVQQHGTLLRKLKPTANTNLAYIMFTSGSSGEPKGVLIEHEALATTILENGRQLKYSTRTRTLSFTAYTFDLNVMEIYLTLLHGGCLFIPNESQRLGNLCGYINEKQIEMALLTPTAIRNLLQEPSQVPSLKILHAGGEPLPQTIIQQWSCYLRLINSYGPTETCVDACRNAHITPDTDPSNIGYSIGTHLWVVNPSNHSQLTPVGCPGELLISGPTLAKGYLNDEEKTRHAFIDGSTFPWAFPDENRFYATGDIVRQNADGSINYIGRRDLQVKLHGIRIELEEIEFAIERCEGVAAAVVDKVFLRDNDSEALVAFFTPAVTKPGKGKGQLLSLTDPLQSIIRNASDIATRTLSPFMVPKFYLPIDRIPLNISGKMDRTALRQIFDECSRGQISQYQSSRKQKRNSKTTTQKILQGLWAQVLSLDPNEIGLDSEFISLGGESLAAIKLAAMCREIGFQLDITDILRNTNLEHMAMIARRGLNVSLEATHVTEDFSVNPNNNYPDTCWSSTEIAEAAQVCGLKVTEIEDIYYCTPMQEALMAVTVRVPEAYVARNLFQVPSSVDMGRFRRAWELVHENNPILRTRICSITTSRGVENLQVVCKCIPDWVEGTSVDSCHTSMGLGTPLVRYKVTKSLEGFVFEVLKHHAVYDGFSGKLIWEDFLHAFTHQTRPQKRPSYRLYVDYLRSISKEKTLEYWKRSLEGFQGERFPTLPSLDYIPKASSKSCQTIKADIQWNGSCRFTFATVVRSAWAVILSMRGRTSGPTKDVCFVATTTGRTVPLDGLENMTGPTITTVPIRVEFDLDQTIEQYLQQIQNQAISMLAFEHFGLGEIQGISDEAREACKSTNLLVVQPAQMQEDEFPLGLSRLMDDGEEMIELFGLVIECIQSATRDSMLLSASYDTTVMAEHEVHHLLQQFLKMITELNNKCTASSTIRSTLWSLAGDDDFQQTVKWNSTPQETSSTCLHELMEKSARLHPGRLAIDAHDGKLTYKELDAAAEALATVLRDEYNIKPGDLIPLCFEKSSFMIVAIMGILKSGAGYIPLDISHPSSRVEYIIREVGARLVLVSPLQAQLSSFQVSTLIMDPKILLTPPTQAEGCLATPQDIAYIIFTSGSSGKPKGVITEHGASSLSVLEHGKIYQHNRYGSSLRALQFSSYTFDASVLDIFATLAYGGCLCIPSEQERLGHLEDILARMDINFADLTPTVASLLKPSRTPTLRGLAIGGEMANQALIEKWTSTESPLKVFVNSYGPTEATIGCAAGDINPALPVGHIGKRIGGSLWIVDETSHNHLVPVSCVGELVISGPTLARGYLNDTEKTKQAFIEDVPWLARIGEKRLYKTGDLARFDMDGNVEILGRREDGQIKLHGLRLELGEIENGIRACQYLSAAQYIASAKVDLNGYPTLAAFIQLRGEDDHIHAALPDSILGRPSERYRKITNNAEEVLRGHLPEYMIPRLWIPVSTWPLTSSGKTDRKCLAAACEALSQEIITEYQRPSLVSVEDNEPVSMTQTEKVVGDAWKQVLRKMAEVIIRPEDDFFRLGGDSLSTIMLISALRSKDLHITAQEIFVSKCLRTMAQLIDSKASIDKSTSISTTSTPTSNANDRSWSTIAPSPSEFSLVNRMGNEVNSDISSAISNSASVEEAPTLSKVEICLRSLWASALCRPETLFLAHDDFFSCGGDAIAALRLSRMASEANLCLSGPDIYTHRTLSNMANCLQHSPDVKPTRSMECSFLPLSVSRDISVILAEHSDIEDVLPASHTQLSFLIEGQKWCRSYYAWSFIDVGVSAPLAQVQEACNIVAQRHAILRTSFHLVGRHCYQAIRRSVCDFKILLFDSSQNQMCEALDQNVEDPVCFDQVLTRFRLLIDPESGRQILALGLSHAQYDGFCLSTILDDLRLSYLGELPKSRISPSYNRFIEHTLQVSNEETNIFWRQTLKGSRITSIVQNSANSRPIMNQSMRRIVPFKFNHLGVVSHAAMLKAAWALVLSRISQSTDVTFGNLVSGRFAAFEGAQDVVGPCLNFIPTRVRIGDDLCFRDLIQKIHEQQVAAIPYESTPFDQISQQADWPTTARYSSIFQYQNLPDQVPHEGNPSSASASTWTSAGNAVYGGGLLQDGACWLMAWPPSDDQAAFRFTFSEETLSIPRATAIIDLFIETLYTINDNLEGKVFPAFIIPIDERLLMSKSDDPPSLQEPSYLPKLSLLPPSYSGVLEHLSATWAVVLHPSSPATPEKFPTISQDDSFFDLGGDSISAAAVSSLSERAGFKLKLQDIIDFPTLRLQTLLLVGQIQRPVREQPRLHYSPDHKFS